MPGEGTLCSHSIFRPDHVHARIYIFAKHSVIGDQTSDSTFSPHHRATIGRNFFSLSKRHADGLEVTDRRFRGSDRQTVSLRQETTDFGFFGGYVMEIAKSPQNLNLQQEYSILLLTSNNHHSQCNSSFTMNSNEETLPWISILPSSVAISNSVTECCNGFIAWWNGIITVHENNNANQEEAQLVEPLVEQQSCHVMDERFVPTQDLILEEEQNEETNLEEVADIENAVMDENNDVIQSNVMAEENESDPTEATRADEPFETIASEPVSDIEKALFKNSENEASPSQFFDVEEQDEMLQPAILEEKQSSPLEDKHEKELQPLLGLEFSLSQHLNTDNAVEMDIENSPSPSEEDPHHNESPQPTISQMQQILFQDEYEEELQSFPCHEKTSSQALDIEHALATIDDECDDRSTSAIVVAEQEEQVARPSSIFRSSTPETSGDQVTQTGDSGESLQEAQDTFQDEHAIIMATRSNVKKRVSDLIGIFESLSMDEEENVTPTSLGSASSFSGPKSAHDNKCPCCHHKIYPTDATIAYHDMLFHGGCFKCHLCDRKFSRGLSEVAGLVTTKEEDCETSFLTCTKCRDDAAVKHLPLRKSTPACQPITVTSPEKGNIQQVKDEIGDDLESVMDGMIPRCAVCGMHFLGSRESSEMMTVGMIKYHPKCRFYGRPMVERCERKVLPIVAANYAPESLVVRISNTVSDNVDSTQEVMTTLYFILPDKAADLQRIRGSDRPNENVNFEYIMDSSAYANPNYQGTKKKTGKTTFPCHGVGDANSSLSVGFLGDPFGLPIRLANTRIVEDRGGALLFCAELECFKFQLRHRFDLVMHKKGEMVDLKTATLSMNIST